MSIFPCDSHGQRYRGAASHAYVAITHGGSAQRRTLRLCGGCCDQLVEYCSSSMIQSDDGVITEPLFEAIKCMVCALAPIDEHLAFATIYPRGNERTDYWGVVCAQHTDSVRGALLLAYIGP